jgi:hypothetical protein
MPNTERKSPRILFFVKVQPAVSDLGVSQIRFVENDDPMRFSGYISKDGVTAAAWSTSVENFNNMIHGLDLFPDLP